MSVLVANLPEVNSNLITGADLSLIIREDAGNFNVSFTGFSGQAEAFITDSDILGVELQKNFSLSL